MSREGYNNEENYYPDDAPARASTPAEPPEYFDNGCVHGTEREDCRICSTEAPPPEEVWLRTPDGWQPHSLNNKYIPRSTHDKRVAELGDVLEDCAEEIQNIRNEVGLSETRANRLLVVERKRVLPCSQREERK